MENFEGKRISKGVQQKSRLAEPFKRAAVSSIMGDVIFSTTGEALGHIIDVMFDISNGRIEFVVMAHGGFLGYYSQYSKIPYSDLSIDRHYHHGFILNETKGSLSGYTKFGKHQWRDSTSLNTNSRDTDYVDFMNGDDS
ncbi:MAG TPA: PRC-barrel domain-containing protein [Chryseolinea sp.]|nr:PRC-barrel domain-containing protein [Chryseolinea sp.]